MDIPTHDKFQEISGKVIKLDSQHSSSFWHKLGKQLQERNQNITISGEPAQPEGKSRKTHNFEVRTPHNVVMQIGLFYSMQGWGLSAFTQSGNSQRTGGVFIWGYFTICTNPFSNYLK